MDLSKYDSQANGIKILSRKQLSFIGMGVLQERQPDALTVPQKTDIIRLIEDGFYLDILEKPIFRPGNPIIGMCAFYDGTIQAAPGEEIALKEGDIVIEQSLAKEKGQIRQRSTMAHELSHWILHRGYFTPKEGEFCFRKALVACREDAVGRENGTRRRIRTDREWLEFQANCLAAALLMPQKTFTEAFLEACRDNHFSGSALNGAEDLYKENLIVRSLANIFQVSLQSVRIRIRELELMA